MNHVTLRSPVFWIKQNEAFVDMDMHINSPPKAQKADKFIIRFPAGMRQKIASVAKCSRRSMNSEIVMRLEQSLNQQSAVEAEAADFTEFHDKPQTRDALPQAEQRLLSLFHALSPEKKHAVLLFLQAS